jgi:hypothetical protein
MSPPGLSGHNRSSSQVTSAPGLVAGAGGDRLSLASILSVSGRRHPSLDGVACHPVHSMCRDPADTGPLEAFAKPPMVCSTRGQHRQTDQQGSAHRTALA